MSDGSNEHPHMTVGLDLGDRYSYLCLIDQHSDEVIEEGRLRTTHEAFKRRFASACVVGTHSRGNPERLLLLSVVTASFSVVDLNRMMLMCAPAD